MTIVILKLGLLLTYCRIALARVNISACADSGGNRYDYYIVFFLISTALIHFGEINPQLHQNHTFIIRGWALAVSEVDQYGEFTFLQLSHDFVTTAEKLQLSLIVALYSDVLYRISILICFFHLLKCSICEWIFPCSLLLAHR